MDILNLKQIENSIEKLLSSSGAKWGKMTAQHMIEHLVFSIRFSNGKMPQNLMVSQEKAANIKDYFLKQNNNFEPGYKIPLLGEELPPLVFENLEKAKENLLLDLSEFYKYFKENPDDKPVNIIMGPLSKDEWIKMHIKHLEHHFKQFGI